MKTDDLPGETGNIMKKEKHQRTWGVWLVLGISLVVAVAGVIYGWQANVNSKIANQGLATAQADEQGMSSQVALAESTAQAALRQQANAERSAQEARDQRFAHPTLATHYRYHALDVVIFSCRPFFRLAQNDLAFLIGHIGHIHRYFFYIWQIDESSIDISFDLVFKRAIWDGQGNGHNH
jgi:hypothetical protein